MRILALSHDTEHACWDHTESLLEREAAHVWQLVQQGVIREIWFKKPENDAVLILECESLEQAQAILADFPLVSAGLIAFDLSELVAYSGFERLFRTPPRG